MRRLWLLVVLASCRHRAPEPVAMAPPDPAPPIVLVAAEPAEFRLETPAYGAPLLRVARPGDIAFPMDEDLSVLRNDVAIEGVCGSPVCVAEHVVPGEGVRLRHLQGATIEVKRLQDVRPVRLEPGVPVVVPVAEIGPGDPRGPIAVGAFTLTGTRDVAVSATPVHEGPKHRGNHMLGLEVVGPRGVEYAPVQGRGEGGYTSEELTLPAGEYQVRVAPEPAWLLDQMCADDPDFPPPPEWCDPRADDEAFAVRLEWTAQDPTRDPGDGPPEPWGGTSIGDEPVTVEIPAYPAPTTQRLVVPADHDLHLTWDTPGPSVQLYTNGPDGEAWYNCESSPYVLPAVAAPWVDVRMFAGDEPRQVGFTATAHPPPEPVLTLPVGYVADTHTEAGGDGAWVELALEIPAAGDYQIVTLGTVSVVGDIEIFAPEGLSASHSLLNFVYEGDTLYSMEQYTFSGPGTYRARIGSRSGEPQPLKVGLQTPE
jgi:hypothetical protein